MQINGNGDKNIYIYKYRGLHRDRSDIIRERLCMHKLGNLVGIPNDRCFQEVIFGNYKRLVDPSDNSFQE